MFTVYYKQPLEAAAGCVRNVHSLLAYPNLLLCEILVFSSMHMIQSFTLSEKEIVMEIETLFNYFHLY